MIIQIYEIQTRDEAQILVEMGVDHIGSVLICQKNWQVPAIKDTMDFVAQTSSKTSLIPLFNTPETIFRALDYYQPDIVHFCETLADENGILKNYSKLIALQKDVKKRFDKIKIIRSIPIAQPGLAHRVPSLELSKIFEPVSDFFLTDTLILSESDNCQNQPVSGFVGITGKTCDWDLAAKLVKTSRIPVILAGGISPQNVVNGIKQTMPAGVDSCTQTNALDSNGQPIRFKKDMEKIRQIVESVRNINIST